MHNITAPFHTNVFSFTNGRIPFKNGTKWPSMVLLNSKENTFAITILSESHHLQQSFKSKNLTQSLNPQRNYPLGGQLVLRLGGTHLGVQTCLDSVQWKTEDQSPPFSSAI
jgi:hypothetical protein